MLIAVLPDLTNCMFQEHNLSSNPRRCITNLKKDQSRRSYAFWKSNLRKPPLSPFDISQNFWKTTTGRPSGPGAEQAFIEAIARPTSLGENGRVSSAFSASVTCAASGQKSEPITLSPRYVCFRSYLASCSHLLCVMTRQPRKPCEWPFDEFMIEAGFKDEFDALVHNVGLEEFISDKCEQYVALTGSFVRRFKFSVGRDTSVLFDLYEKSHRGNGSQPKPILRNWRLKLKGEAPPLGVEIEYKGHAINLRRRGGEDLDAGGAIILEGRQVCGHQLAHRLRDCLEDVSELAAPRCRPATSRKAVDKDPHLLQRWHGIRLRLRRMDGDPELVDGAADEIVRTLPEELSGGEGDREYEGSRLGHLPNEVGAAEVADVGGELVVDEVGQDHHPMRQDLLGGQSDRREVRPNRLFLKHPHSRKYPLSTVPKHIYVFFKTTNSTTHNIYIKYIIHNMCPIEIFCFPCNVPQQWHHEVGNPNFHGTEPGVPRVRPGCSTFPRASVSSSFSLSGMNVPSCAAAIQLREWSLHIMVLLVDQGDCHISHRIARTRKSVGYFVLPHRTSTSLTIPRGQIVSLLASVIVTSMESIPYVNSDWKLFCALLSKTGVSSSYEVRFGSTSTQIRAIDEPHLNRKDDGDFDSPTSQDETPYEKRKEKKQKKRKKREK
ncbi:hypothetical protein ZWY2020_006109 [Hordeum vulgare]|nr:hypothetical protein ZWY2020_006109 [Hordeum vulgare]